MARGWRRQNPFVVDFLLRSPTAHPRQRRRLGLGIPLADVPPGQRVPPTLRLMPLVELEDVALEAHPARREVQRVFYPASVTPIRPAAYCARRASMPMLIVHELMIAPVAWPRPRRGYSHCTTRSGGSQEEKRARAQYLVPARYGAVVV